MSFEFLGTFTRSQFNRFATYARAQTTLLNGRIQHLKAEQARIGTLGFAFDAGGIPTHMTSSDQSTYIGKLYTAYEALGGDPEFDLQVRSTTQAVFKMSGDETQTSQMLSNGDIMGTPGLSDASTADLMGRAKDWTHGDLAYRRNALERKIRRAVDYAEQLQAEIAQLQTIQAEASVEGALEFLLSGITQALGDRQYMAASDDSANPDPHGKRAHAPFAAYMPGPDRTEVSTFQRTLDGPSVPTGTGT